MPDQFGNITIEDGLNFAQGLMSLQANKMRVDEMTADKQAIGLAEQLVQNPDMKLDPAKVTPDVAYKARVKAAELTTTQLNNSTAALQNKAAQYKARYDEDMPQIQKIIATRESGDRETYYNAVTDFYNKRVYDGTDVTLSKDESGNPLWTTKDRDGSERTIPFPSDSGVDQFISFYQDPGNYIAVNSRFDSDIRKANLDAMNNGKPLMTKKGEQTGFYIANVIDPKSKQAGTMIYNPMTGQEATQEEMGSLKKLGVVTGDQYESYLKMYKLRNEVTQSAQGVVINNQRIGLNEQEAGLKGLEAAGKKWDIYNKSQQSRDASDKQLKDLNTAIYTYTHKKEGGVEMTVVPTDAEMMEINQRANALGLEARVQKNKYGKNVTIALYDGAGKKVAMGPEQSLEPGGTGLAGAAKGTAQAAEIMTEAQARSKLKAKGITGKSQDDWIKKYIAAGKVR